jgi:hypothetical protein
MVHADVGGQLTTIAVAALGDGQPFVKVPVRHGVPIPPLVVPLPQSGARAP